ncbi:MAG: hypothetical protein ACI4L9_04830, partial [Candidatus Coproplasma sp.]
NAIAPAQKESAQDFARAPESGLKAEDVGDSPFNRPANNVTEEPKPRFNQPTLWEAAPQGAPAQVGSLTDEQKKQVFGKFLRLFRTTRRNAVLFTLCMDLESEFEGDKIIFYTDSDAVYKPLTREDNSRYIKDALAELGVFSHEVRLKGKAEDKYESAERRLRENFKGFDVDVK